MPRPNVGGWRDRLLCKLDAKGRKTDKLRPVTANAITILGNEPVWAGVLAYDAFSEEIVVQKTPPWRDDDKSTDPKLGSWSEEDTIRTQSWLADAHALDIGLEATISAVRVVAHRTRIHPVRDWLDSLRWDGQRRLPTWLADVFGSEDTPYVRAVGTAWAVSAIARAYDPGCKVDTVLVLEGKPGTFKSSVLRALAGDDLFLEMSIADVATKDAMQLLRRKWIAEFPEIDGLSRTEQAHVKAYFSRQTDTYRPSYGRATADFKRQIVFAATTNKSEYLTDETGGTGRRMWPVKCVRGSIEVARAIRDQFWAEARARFESGEAWHITDPEVRDAALSEQDARFRPDTWEVPIAEWLAKPCDLGSRAIAGVTTADVLTSCLHIELGKQSHLDAIRAGAVLRRLGWVPGNPETRNGARVRMYRPVEGAGTNGHTLVPIAEPSPLELPVEHDEDMFPPTHVRERV